MGLEELINNINQRDLSGTLRGTLESNNVAAPGVESPIPSPFSIASTALPTDTANPIPGLLPPKGGPVTAALGAVEDVAEKGIEGSAGYFSALGNVTRPAREGLGFILEAFQRPQEGAFASSLKALEDENAGALDLATAYGSGFLFKDVETSHHRKIRASELINAVGKRVLGVDKIHDKMDPVQRSLLKTSIYLGYDPMLLLSFATPARGGKLLREFWDAARRTDVSGYVLEGGGTGLRGMANIINSQKINEIVRKGGLDTPIAQIQDKLINAVPPTADEMRRLADFSTGLEYRSAASQMIKLAWESGPSGKKLIGTPEDYEAIMARLGSPDVTPEDVAPIMSVFNRKLAQMRGETDQVTRYIQIPQKVEARGGRSAVELVTIEAMDNPVLSAGQLMNRLGLDPGDALEPELGRAVSRAVKELSAKQLEVGAIKEFARDPEGLMTLWSLLPPKSRMAALTPIKKAGKTTLRGSNTSLSQKLPHTKADADKIFGSLTQVEKNNVVKEALKRQDVLPAEVRDRLRAPATRPQFFREVSKQLEGVEVGGRKISLPSNASEAFKAAAARSEFGGPFLTNRFIASQLGQRFAAADITIQGAREAAEYMSGARTLNQVTDAHEALLAQGVMESMLDRGDWATRDWHILTSMLSPDIVLPRPIYSVAKSAEDAFIQEGQQLSKRLQTIYNFNGKVMKRGSTVDNALGHALNLEDEAAGLEYLKTFDNNRGELRQMYLATRSFLDSFADRFERAGFKDFEKNKRLKDYFLRIYRGGDHPKFGMRATLQEFADEGIISPDEMADAIQRSAKRNIHMAGVSPLEMDFVDTNQVWFSHLKRRGIPEVNPSLLESSAIDGMRAYIYGAMRKLHLEPAIKRINKASKDLPHSQKSYTKSFLQRMLGIEGNQERRLNSSLEAIQRHIGATASLGGQKASNVIVRPRPATRASLFFTRRTYSGLLGFNLGFVIKNLSQGINTATERGPFNFLKGVTMYVTDKKFRKVVEDQNLLRSWHGLFEKNQFGIGSTGPLSKLDDMLFSTATFSEQLNRGIAFAAGMTDELNIARRAGKTKLSNWADIAEKQPEVFRNALRGAHATANETQFIYGVIGRAPISGTPVGRLGLQFWSFPVKQMELIAKHFPGISKGAATSDDGVMFLMRYLTLGGMASKMAEHNAVDATSFTGFGFWEGQASPAVQFMHGWVKIASGVAQGDKQSIDRGAEMVGEQIKNMIPGILQLQKSAGAFRGVETGEEQGFRERLSFRTDVSGTEEALTHNDGILQDLLDGTINKDWVRRTLGFKGPITDQQAIKFLGLSSNVAREQRKLSRQMSEEARLAREELAKRMDKWGEAITGGDFSRADKIRAQAKLDGYPFEISQGYEAIRQGRLTGVNRALNDMSRAQRLQRVLELRRDNPKLAQELGLMGRPPDDLGNVPYYEGLEVPR